MVLDVDVPAPPPVPGLRLSRFVPGDAAELLVLQRCCWVSEAVANDTLAVPPLHESVDDVLAWGPAWLTLVGRVEHRLVAGVRARAAGEDWQIGRVMVAPDLAGRGVGSWLLRVAEGLAPAGTSRCTLFTGARSARNLALYARAGYTVDEVDLASPGHVPGTVALSKPRPAAPAR